MNRDKKNCIRSNNVRLMDLALNNLRISEEISEGAVTLIKRIRDDSVYSTSKIGKIRWETIKDYYDKFPEEFEKND